MLNPICCLVYGDESKEGFFDWINDDYVDDTDNGLFYGPFAQCIVEHYP